MAILSTLWSIVAIIFGFGVLIFIHELGHFIAAKWAGIRTEAFAVGMGPVIFSWRKGLGLVFGSTDRKVRERTGKAAAELKDEDLATHGLGETEYSLRWLPIGGFVKMLGQEDANPKAVSDDPRSYNRTGIGKRMVVVSAGVIMNVLLAMVLFVWAFMVGVQFDAPTLGGSLAGSPSAKALPINAETLGITEPGLEPGDIVLTIDGEATRTFADVRIAAAMAKPDETLNFTVERAGYDQPLEFSIVPKISPQSGLLSIGVAPASSTMLGDNKASRQQVEDELERTGLASQGIAPGMKLVAVEGESITSYGRLARIFSERNGASIETTWIDPASETDTVFEATLDASPEWQSFQILDASGTEGTFDLGLLGLTPLTRINEVAENSGNTDVLRDGDVILKVEQQLYPRISQLQAIVAEHAGGTVSLLVERDGESLSLEAEVSGKGVIGVSIKPFVGDARTADPVTEVSIDPTEEGAPPTTVDTPIAASHLMPGTRIMKLNEVDIADWRDLFIALRTETVEAHAAGVAATVSLTVQHPTSGGELETVDVPLTIEQVQSLHALEWTCELASGYFDPLKVTLSAEGNPLTAISMGFHETHKMVMMTYLTIDRLFRGSVGVKQLRGPVGIIDLGSKILPAGFMYFLFFLGMISVNLAVINFLPIPIVDGGLFLFLIYEKFKGKPPSIAFQNAATIVGLCLIGSIFVITFYNDIMRLIG